MFNNNGRTSPAEKHTFCQPHPAVAAGAHMHGHTFKTQQPLSLVPWHTQWFTHTHIHTHKHTQQSVTSDMDALPTQPSITTGLLVHVHACVYVYEWCRPQHIWPSFRNNGHGEWLAWWASWLREVIGGMFQGMPRMERWSVRPRRGRRQFYMANSGSGVIVMQLFWLGTVERGTPMKKRKVQTWAWWRVCWGIRTWWWSESESGSLHIV